MPSDATLAAFDRVYNDTSRVVLIYLNAKCANPADVADLFQETFAEVFSVLQKRGPDYLQNPKAFTLRVARQKLSRHYGLLLRRRETRPLPQEPEEPFTPPPTDWIDEQLVNEALLARADALLAKKSADVQKIFRLHYGLELTIAEISAALGITQSNVKNKLYRTLVQLRKELSE